MLNVLLNLLFVIMFQMAEAGVALASAVSQYVSAGLIVLSLARRPESIGLHRSLLRLDGNKSRQILSISIPSGLQNAIFAIANLFIQAGVNTFDAVMVEGNAAAANADALIYDVMAAVYLACSSFMSQNYGAGHRERVKKSYLLCLGLSFGIAAVMSAVLVIFGINYLSLFTKDAEVVEAGLTRLKVMGCSYAFSALMDCTIAASRGLGRSMVPTVIVILGSCVFRVIWVFTVFAHFHTILSLYLLYIFSWTIKRFHCFGCQADGDVISFASRLFDLKPKDAALKLSVDFGIQHDRQETDIPDRKKHIVSDQDIFLHKLS